MQLITSKGFYFCGTKKELYHFLKNLSIYYTTVTQVLNQKNNKKLH